MTKSALKMITDYLESQGKLVYAKNIDSMNSELADLRAQVDELRLRLQDTTDFVSSFICQCEPETGNAPCARCYIVWRNNEALAATDNEIHPEVKL